MRIRLLVCVLFAVIVAPVVKATQPSDPPPHTEVGPPTQEQQAKDKEVLDKPKDPLTERSQAVAQPPLPATSTDPLTRALTGPWAAGIGILIGIAGIVIAVYTYKRTRREQGPVYSLDHRTVFNKAPTEPVDTAKRLTVTWAGEPIGQLSITRVLIGNDGTETIKESDIHDKDILRLTYADDVRVLDAVIEATSAEGIQPVVSVEDRSSVTIKFAYLAPRDGAIIRVLLTGGHTSTASVAGRTMTGKKWRSVVSSDKSTSSFYISLTISFIITYIIIRVMTS